MSRRVKSQLTPVGPDPKAGTADKSETPKKGQLRNALYGIFQKREKVKSQLDNQSDTKTPSYGEQRLEEAKKRIEEAKKRTEKTEAVMQVIAEETQTTPIVSEQPTQGATNNETAEATNESIPYYEERMNYAWQKETYNGEMSALMTAYYLLKIHRKYGKGDNNKPYGARTLMGYLGLDADNLIKILRAVFSTQVTKLSKAKVWTMFSGEYENIDDFIYHKLLHANKDTGKNIAEERIDNSIGNKLSELSEFLEYMALNGELIREICMNIFDEEEMERIKEEQEMGEEKDSATLRTKRILEITSGKINIAENITVFDDTKLNQLIADLNSPTQGGDNQGQKQAQPQQPAPQPQPQRPAPQPTLQPQPTQQTQAQPQQSQQPTAIPKQLVAHVPINIICNELLTEDFEISTAVNTMLTKIRGYSENERNAFADKVNNLDEYSGLMLGFDLVGLANNPRPVKVLEIISDRLNANDSQSLKQKVLQLDALLRNSAYL